MNRCCLCVRELSSWLEVSVSIKWFSLSVKSLSTFSRQKHQAREQWQLKTIHIENRLDALTDVWVINNRFYGFFTQKCLLVKQQFKMWWFFVNEIWVWEIPQTRTNLSFCVAKTNFPHCMKKINIKLLINPWAHYTACYIVISDCKLYTVYFIFLLSLLHSMYCFAKLALYSPSYCIAEVFCIDRHNIQSFIRMFISYFVFASGNSKMK